MEKDIVEKKTPFKFKQFSLNQDNCAMKIGTDGVLLGAWCEVDGAKKILDIGSGTGVIAIMAAQRNETATVHAVEIDDKAFEQAKSNMKDCKWCERLEVFHHSIQDFCKQSSEKYDVIISNPPFFSGGTLSANTDRNNMRHTVKLPTGDLLRAAQMLLAPEGRFCVILPLLEGLRFKERSKSYKLFCTKMTEVKATEAGNVERLLLQFELVDMPMVKESLCIAKKERDFTDEYIKLTSPFYLKM